MKTLYLVTEAETFKGETETQTFLSDMKHEAYKGDDYAVECVKATFETVTLDMMISAIEDDLENANYHSLESMPRWLSDVLHKSLSPDQVKQIFWDLIQDKGTLWAEWRDR